MPYGQDDWLRKPQSLKARLELLPATLDAALQGRQLQPLLREPLSGGKKYSLIGVRGRLSTRSSSPVNGQKKPANKRKTLRPCQSLSFSGEVARHSRDGEGCFQDEPSQSPTATALPKGEPLQRRISFVHTRQRLEEACL